MGRRRMSRKSMSRRRIAIEATREARCDTRNGNSTGIPALAT
jgi:hypothetical protein